MKRCLGTLSIIFLLLLVFFLVPLQSDPEISSPRAGSGGEASALGLSIVSFRILAPRGETNSQGFKKLTGSWKDRDVAINAGKSSAEASLHRLQQSYRNVSDDGGHRSIHSDRVKRPSIVRKRSTDILHDPWFNKVGVAFSYSIGL